MKPLEDTASVQYRQGVALNDTFTVEPKRVVGTKANMVRFALGDDLDVLSDSSSLSSSSLSEGSGECDQKLPVPLDGGGDAQKRAQVLRRMLNKLDIEEKLKKPDGIKVPLGQELQPHAAAAETVGHASCDSSVLKWLQSLHLKDGEKYGRIFAEHEADMESLKLMTEEQLKEMGITAVGTLNKMVFSIKDMRGENIDIASSDLGRAAPSEQKVKLLQGEPFADPTGRPHSGISATVSTLHDKVIETSSARSKQKGPTESKIKAVSSTRVVNHTTGANKSKSLKTREKPSQSDTNGSRPSSAIRTAVGHGKGPSVVKKKAVTARPTSAIAPSSKRNKGGSAVGMRVRPSSAATGKTEEKTIGET